MLRRDAPQLLVQTRPGIPKNIDTLIRAIAIVRRTHRDVMLHVVGSGARRTTLETLAATVANGAVTFHGFLPTEQLDVIPAACDIFAFALSDADADVRRSAADDSIRSRFSAATVGPELESFRRG